jgi:hypothetical protein
MPDEKKPKKSWKTTACGVLGIIIAVCMGAKAQLDGDPETSLNFGEIITAVGVFIPSVAAIFARDNDKSSEDVGASG